MNKKIRLVIIFIVCIILIIILTPSFGALYESIIGRNISSGFWGPSHPEYFEGFFMAYMLIISLSFTIFGGKNRHKILLILLGAVVAFDLILLAVENLIINIATAFLGWLLGELILLIYKKLALVSKISTKEIKPAAKKIPAKR